MLLTQYQVIKRGWRGGGIVSQLNNVKWIDVNSMLVFLSSMIDLNAVKRGVQKYFIEKNYMQSFPL